MKRLVIYFSFVVLAMACGTSPNTPANTIEAPPTGTATADNNQPSTISYQLVKVYPHDGHCYTEGLQYINGHLLESAGNYTKSDIRISDLTTGNVIKKKTLEDKYFGEGCTQLGDKIYQMTYRENTCFVYDTTFKKIGQFGYNFGQGWGMTTNGHQLIISNGGNNLYFMDPATFKEIKRLGVTNQYGPVAQINELELIKGYIYANVYQTEKIIKIDTATGKVVGEANLSGIRSQNGIPELRDAQEEYAPEVMNGIAYDSAQNRIFITGKHWPKLFEIKLDN